MYTFGIHSKLVTFNYVLRHDFFLLDKYVLYSGALQRVNRHKSAKLVNQNVTRWMKSFETVPEWFFFLFIPENFLIENVEYKELESACMTYANFDVFAREFSSELKYQICN